MRKKNYKQPKKVHKNNTSMIRKQKAYLTILLFVLASIVILLGTTINVFAGSKANVSSYNKYYKSVQIEAGDTLWDLADEYIGECNLDKTDYISEICEINEICEDEIHAGDYIVVAYYSQDIK